MGQRWKQVLRNNKGDYMAKFKIVKEIPKSLKNDEMVIKTPDFIEEINECPAPPTAKLRDGTKIATSNYLRKIVEKIGLNYGSLDFNPMTACKTIVYDGVAYDDVVDLSKKIVVPMLRNDCPSIFYNYIDAKIKGRDPKVSLIYFVGDDIDTKAFMQNGITKFTKKEDKK